MGENNEERLARKKRERAEYLAQEKADAELAKKLDDDPEFAKDFDRSFERSLSSIDDELMERFAKKQGYSKAETEAMKKAAHRAAKAMRGGFFSAPKPEEAEKIVMGNRGLREMKKKKKSCAVIAVLLLSIGGSAIGAALYGAVEIVGALTR